jgi:hypothetical protein
VVLLAPAALLLGLALASGGFFPDSVAVAAVALIVMFMVRAVASSDPFAGVGTPLRLVAAALIAFAIWTLVSSSWSGSPARAAFEYNRLLLYIAAFALTGVLGRSVLRAKVLLYGVTVVSVGISIASAATWLLPNVFPAAADVGRERLAWPTSYWNATGLIAALALVWSFSLSASSTVQPRVRVIAAVGAPLATAALIFTVSRGAVAVAALGLILAAVLIRSTATPAAIAAIAPACGLAVAIAIGISGLSVDKPSAHAIAAGHRAAAALLAVAAAAGVLRAVLLRLDARLEVASPRWTRTRLRTAFALALGVLVVGFLTLGGPAAVQAAVDKFVSPETSSVRGSLPARQRLTRLGSNGRIDSWRVAFVHGFRAHPIRGTGAGTYATLWTRYAPSNDRVLDAHSLYIEQLGELGLVGAALLFVSIASILIALGRRARGPDREVWAAFLAGGIVWAVHAGIDWDWEMPAVTAWLFAAGGLALASPLGRRHAETSPRVRFTIALGCLLLTVSPAAIWRSQTQLIKSIKAFERGDCVTAQRAALASNAALPSRSDPFELISYCQAGARQFPLALGAIHAARERDPRNWELAYSDALIRAAAGLDPRPAARAALAMYPASPTARAAVRGFSTGNRRAWRRFAVSAPLPVPPSSR